MVKKSFVYWWCEEKNRTEPYQLRHFALIKVSINDRRCPWKREILAVDTDNNRNLPLYLLIDRDLASINVRPSSKTCTRYRPSIINDIEFLSSIPSSRNRAKKP